MRQARDSLGAMSDSGEDAFRETRRSLVQIACPFERALLSGCVQCGRMRRVLVAEREAVACSDAAASERCAQVRDALRGNARFALGLTDADGPWPFGKEIRAQCGGLLGLERALRDEDDAIGTTAADGPVDVDRLLHAALGRYGAIDALPYARLIRSVAGYQPRPGRKPPPR